MLSDLPRIALFAMAGLFVVGLIATQRNYSESLRRSRADLEDKVRDLEKLNAALRIGETYLAERSGLATLAVLAGTSRTENLWSRRATEYSNTTRHRIAIEMALNRVYPDDAASFGR